ncbi:MAG: AAA family ATPase [Paludibacteraceae bacterium]|nr:AAA family ATPase [Paludibacteraceae bacterium]
MGRFIKIGNAGFRAVINGGFVDKSMLIDVINQTLNTERQYTCVSRARRFGKTIAAKMLYAYYDCWCDYDDLFEGLQIKNQPSFSIHYHRYPVIYLDMTDFVTRYTAKELVPHIQSDVITELRDTFPSVAYPLNANLSDTLYAIASNRTHEKFITIIDEWDAPLREYAEGSNAAEQYINLLRGLFKSATAMSTFAGVYMTGILPIKKYKTQSALNNFHEYSAVQPGVLAEYFGFTAAEVQRLCADSRIDYKELKEWYDGYQIGNSKEMFNPTSVTTALYNRYCDCYWANSGAYDALSAYIRMNFDGLKDDVVRLLAGGDCHVDTTSFQNDLHIVRTKDDVLTLLIHLGYLSYDRNTKTCRIPNREVSVEFKNAIVAETGWMVIANAIKQSQQLLNDTLNGNQQAVAKALDAIHSDNTSVLQYNDENSLACVLSIAYYAAKKDYTLIHELPDGKGFADVLLLPRQGCLLPPIILELKYNKSADTAIKQIVEKRYDGELKNYAAKVVLVGINYDKKSKQHECKIQLWQMQ